MKKILISGLVVSSLVGAGLMTTLIAPVAAQNGGKIQRILFDRTDTNGNGFISKEEFSAAQLKRFNKIDANDDGKLSFEENQKAIEKTRKRLERFRK
ncbi:MAG: EF-hand domain-containing protein [PS1 clade bacterium]|nr:EF-hand domain-containing protein [PS1 clade bacterium]